MLCAPLVITACVLMVVVLDELSLFRDETLVSLSLSLGPLLMAAGWLVVWFRVIRWTQRRWRGTVLLFGMAIAAQAVIAVLAHALITRRVLREPLVGFSNLAVGLISLGLMIRLWTETTMERFARIRDAGADARVCPACRYDMSGLTNLTCPECGTSFTLGQMADEHQRVAAPPDLE